MEGDIELITCWPPSDDISSDTKSDEQSYIKSNLNKRYCPENEDNSPHSSTIKQMKCNHSELLESKDATAAVAQWWKRSPTLRDKYQNQLPKSNNPNTLLNFIFKLPETEQFMQKKLEEILSTMRDNDPSFLAIIGTFYEKLGTFSNAEEYILKAIENQKNYDDPLLKEWKWLLHKIRRKIEITNQQRKAKEKLIIPKELKFPSSKIVERISVENLSVSKFIQEYSMKSIPVIITGLASKMVEKPWTFELLTEKAGDCLVKLKKLVSGSAEWAQLEDAESTKLSRFVDYISNRNSDRYLFDWSLPINCPDLAESLKIPKYFSGDLLQRTCQGSLYKDSWPSLFVAPSDIHSELHIDAFGSNFWMALFQGKKRWIFFSKEDLPYLYPDYVHSMDPVFQVNLSKPDMNKFPLLQLTKPMECVLKEDEVLFVPAGCPHRVENLEQSIAISANFVDQSNFEMVKGELRINALIDSRAAELLSQFESEKFLDSSLSDNDSSEIHTCSWSDFKNPKLKR